MVLRISPLKPKILRVQGCWHVIIPNVVFGEMAQGTSHGPMATWEDARRVALGIANAMHHNLGNNYLDSTKARAENGGGESAPYSFIEHLAKSMLFSRYKGEALMAIFSAYFDASGHPDQGDVLTVAGYAAAVDSWIRFDREWEAILKGEGVTAFHTTHFVSSQGEFASWAGKEQEKVDRRRNFVANLLKCTETHCAKFFRASMFLPDYARVDQEYFLSEAIGRPYAVCSMLVAHSLRIWAHDLEALDTLLYFYEDGDKDKGNFEEKHKEAFGKPARFLLKEEAKAFEAADFNAWKTRTALHESGKPDHTIEKGYNLLRSISILNNVRREGGVLNEWSFRTFCEREKIAKR
jgi:hypothetical protein